MATIAETISKVREDVTDGFVSLIVAGSDRRKTITALTEEFHPAAILDATTILTATKLQVLIRQSLAERGDAVQTIIIYKTDRSTPELAQELREFASRKRASSLLPSNLRLIYIADSTHGGIFDTDLSLYLEFDLIMRKVTITPNPGPSDTEINKRLNDLHTHLNECLAAESDPWKLEHLLKMRQALVLATYEKCDYSR